MDILNLEKSKVKRDLLVLYFSQFSFTILYTSKRYYLQLSRASCIFFVRARTFIFMDDFHKFSIQSFYLDSIFFKFSGFLYT